MKGKKVHVELIDEVTPFAITCPRKLPLAWKSQVKDELDSLVSKGIIRPSTDETSDFVSPLVVVPKPNNKIRVCVDFTKLNKFVKRPVHPFKAPWEAVTDIGEGYNFFSSMDAASGYFQMELDETSQRLTTFLTPWGRYQFLRAPMGLDEHPTRERCHPATSSFVSSEQARMSVDPEDGSFWLETIDIGLPEPLPEQVSVCPCVRL
ncbi:unnamed protein product, partial [Nesidiocoris tenuis]